MFGDRRYVIPFILLLYYLARLVIFFIRLGDYYSVKFLDVGQGDAALVTTRNSVKVLIDGGGNYSADSYLVEWLPANCHINFVVATHPHSDHISGLSRILERCGAGVVFFNEVEYKSGVYEDFKSEAERYDNMALTYPKYVEIDGLKFYVLWPTVSYINSNIYDINNSSIVLLMDYGDFEVLFSGDIGKSVMGRLDMNVIDEVVQDGLDVYKVAHQGSKTSLDKNFISNMSPKVSVVSVGEENRFGHPDSDVIKFLESVGSSVYRTDRVGTVEILF